MRDLEVQRLREKREWEDIPETEEEIKELKRKIYGAGTPLSQEITLSQLVYLVSKELQTGKPPAQKIGIMNYIFMILMLGSLIGGAVQFFRSMRSSEFGSSNQDFDLENDMFTFQHIKYYGQRSRLDYLVWTFLRMFEAYDEFGDEKLQSEYKVTNRNVILYGPPGTGKTLFVKVFSFLLDISLRCQIYKSQNPSLAPTSTPNTDVQTGRGNNGREASSQSAPDSNAATNTQNPNLKNQTAKIALKELKSIPPQVSLISVRQSTFVSKYVGDTEKNLEKLFNFAYRLSENRVVIIFFDEIETVARKRTDMSPDYALNAVSQFLNILDGPSTPRRKKVLLFGATNNKGGIDPAIFRRFYHKFFMPNPNSIQRSHMIQRITEQSLHFNQTQHDHLVNLTEGMSFDSIDKAFVDLKRRTKGPPYHLSYADFEKAFVNQKALVENAENNDQEIDTEDLGLTLAYNETDIDLPHKF